MHHHTLPSHRVVAAALVSLALVACDAITSPTAANSRPVSFSVSTAEGSAASLASFSKAVAAFAVADGPLVIASGSDTLRIDSVRVVLAQVTLAHEGDQACGAL